MARFDRFLGFTFERASGAFGELRRLPPASFRGIPCNDLADQYRRVRTLEIANPDLAALLSGEVRAGAGLQTHVDSAEGSLPRSSARRTFR